MQYHSLLTLKHCVCEHGSQLWQTLKPVSQGTELLMPNKAADLHLGKEAIM